jgi:glycogen debranching enzyme
VQGYVYAAKHQAAQLAAGLGLTARAEQLTRQAQTLQEQFLHAFWCDDLGTYALALDGHKRPCRVRTSNAGQTLFTGIASPAHVRRLAQTLFSDESFSGWGIRTVAASERRYNPMSYHNGSIWPHDNALIALGLARYGYKEQALRIMTGLFDACLFMDLYRLPELFCGFSRRPGDGPIPYPVACAPQAWASATVFMLLHACLGLSFQPAIPRLCFASPLLPAFLQQVHITNFDLAGNILDLDLQYHPQDVETHITRRMGNVEMVIVK